MTQSKSNDSDDKTVWNSDITMSDISTGEEIEDALDEIVVDVEEGGRVAPPKDDEGGPKFLAWTAGCSPRNSTQHREPPLVR